MPFSLQTREWRELVNEDPVNLLGEYRSWSQAVYRFYIASYGQMARYTEFLTDVEMIGRNVMAGSFEGQTKLEANLQEFARSWVERPKFAAEYKKLTNEGFIDLLISRAGIALEADERAGLIDKLTKSEMTRAEALLAVVNKRKFVEKEENRSLVLLHYFGYLHRNPDDAPDKDLSGFNFWVREVDVSGDPGRLARGFMASGENKTGKR